jgi:glycosyltransferase involved in cell wall biosynthesis
VKVLLHNRAHDLWRGGDATVVSELESHLAAAGVSAMYAADVSSPGTFDIVHLHNVSMPWTWEMFGRARAAGARVVISTIYEPGVFDLVTQAQQSQMVAAADALICYSRSEAAAIARDLKADERRVTMIRLGVSSEFATGRPPLPYPYVLHVGRIEPRKNQLALVSAVRDIPVVLAGDVFDHEYHEAVRERAATNVLHLSGVSRDLLRGLYAGARVFCLPTRFEICGLVNLEAAVAGCHVVTSDVGGVREYSGDRAIYVDPDDDWAIAKAVSRLWCLPRPEPAPELAETWSWSRFALEHLAVYGSVLSTVLR